MLPQKFGSHCGEVAGGGQHNQGEQDAGTDFCRAVGLCLSLRLEFALKLYSERNDGAGAAQLKVPKKHHLSLTVVTGRIVLPPTNWII